MQSRRKLLIPNSGDIHGCAIGLTGNFINHPQNQITMKSNNTISGTMNTNNIHVNNIVATLNERNEIRRNIELPALAAISKTATKFDGKVFNRRFTAAVTKTLESNANRITVAFRQKYDGTTEYDIIRVHYCYNGKYSEFAIYPDRIEIKDYTDDAGR